MLSSDHCYVIGKTHQVCQDYALHGVKPVPFVVVCDGCSASPHSDIGARIVAVTAQHVLQQPAQTLPPDYHAFGNKVIQAARSVTAKMQLPDVVLDTTLMVGMVVNTTVWVYVYGDGCVLRKTAAGAVQLSDIYFNHNAPFYLSYWQSPARWQEYADCGATPLAISHSDCSDQVNLPFDEPLLFSFDLDTTPCVALASDGLTHFIDLSDQSRVPLQQVAENLMNFKNNQGEFVKRRVNRALQQYEKQRIIAADDVSLAVLWETAA